MAIVCALGSNHGMVQHFQGTAPGDLLFSGNKRFHISTSWGCSSLQKKRGDTHYNGGKERKNKTTLTSTMRKLLHNGRSTQNITYLLIIIKVYNKMNEFLWSEWWAQKIIFKILYEAFPQLCEKYTLKKDWEEIDQNANRAYFRVVGLWIALLFLFLSFNSFNQNIIHIPYNSPT